MRNNRCTARDGAGAGDGTRTRAGFRDNRRARTHCTSSLRLIRRPNTLIRTRHIGPRIRLGRGIVDNPHRLDIHGERRLGVIRLTTGPLDRALCVIRVAAGPDPDPRTHGRLWVVCAGDGVGVVQGSDEVAVDVPLRALGCPADAVGVECLGGRGYGDGCGAVVAGCVAFTEVVCLDFVVEGADLFLCLLELYFIWWWVEWM